MSLTAALRPVWDVDIDALAQAIDEATDFVFMADATPEAEGGPFITYMNGSMLHAFGYELGEVMGKNPALFWGPKTNRREVERLRATVRRRRDARGEFYAYRKDGSSMWVEFAGKPMRARGASGQWIAIGRDVTESRSRRETLRDLAQFKADLIAMLAHDFCGPLTSIIGYADLLRENDDNPDHRTMLEIIAREAMRLSVLAKDTLTFSALGETEFELVRTPLDLTGLLHDVATSFPRRCIEVRSDGPLPIDADKRLLHQAFENVIGNAVKYSADTAPVFVDARWVRGWTRVDVADRGLGIPREDLPHIFERFARGANVRARGIAGSGFGLYLAKTIVESHRGSIEAQSAIGEGTTFTIRLPVA